MKIIQQKSSLKQILKIGKNSSRRITFVIPTNINEKFARIENETRGGDGDRASPSPSRPVCMVSVDSWRSYLNRSISLLIKGIIIAGWGDKSNRRTDMFWSKYVISNKTLKEIDLGRHVRERKRRVEHASSSKSKVHPIFRPFPSTLPPSTKGLRWLQLKIVSYNMFFISKNNLNNKQTQRQTDWLPKKSVKTRPSEKRPEGTPGNVIP